MAPASGARPRTDAELAEAHTLQGWLRYWCEHDWGGAEQAFRRALTLTTRTSRLPASGWASCC